MAVRRGERERERGEDPKREHTKGREKLRGGEREWQMEEERGTTRVAICRRSWHGDE